jgi:hypothetical protein
MAPDEVFSTEDLGMAQWPTSEPKLHDPEEDGVYIDTEDGETIFLDYTDDADLIDLGLGIRRESAESTLRLQDQS